MKIEISKEDLGILNACCHVAHTVMMEECEGGVKSQKVLAIEAMTARMHEAVMAAEAELNAPGT
jgi:hypothetical protein